MSRLRRTRRNGPSSFLLAAMVALGVLATAGLASAASGTIHVTVTKKQISITGSASAAKEVVQINYDPKKCASYQTELNHATQFSDIRGLKKGAFHYVIKRSALHLAKPKPHYACVYLLTVKGSAVHQIASASTKFS